MTGWDNAIVELKNTGMVKKCPFCGGENVKAEMYIHNSRISYWLSCEKCKNNAHYDGVLTKNNN